MIGLPQLYLLAGLVFAGWALASLLDRKHSARLRAFAFWGLISLEFLAGDAFSDFNNGLILLALVALALAGAPAKGQPATTSPADRQASAAARGKRLFLPALIVPAVALAGTLALPRLGNLVDPRQVTLICLGLGAIIAVTVLMLWLRPPASEQMMDCLRQSAGL